MPKPTPSEIRRIAEEKQWPNFDRYSDKQVGIWIDEAWNEPGLFARIKRFFASLWWGETDPI